MHAFLMHADKDAVGVAIRRIEKGETVDGLVLDGGRRLQVQATAPIPLGHKIAVLTTARGDDLIEYGVPIGVATLDINTGDHVHIHNLRSVRWGALTDGESDAAAARSVVNAS
jgi:(2R)-sulfolactate sulfo-lyase subunit alpha